MHTRPLQNTRRHTVAKLIAATTAALYLALPGTPAAAAIYDIGIGGRWTNAVTWNPSVVGGPTDVDSIGIVDIAASRTVYLVGDELRSTNTVASLTYDETDSVTFLSWDGGASLANTRRTLAVAGDLTKNGAGSLRLRRLYEANSNWGLLAAVGGDVFVNAGTLVFGSQTGNFPILGLTVGGATTVADGAILSLQGSPLSIGTTFLTGTIQTPLVSSGITFLGLNGPAAGVIEVGTDAASAVTTTLNFAPTAGSHEFTGTITQGGNLAYAFTKKGDGLQAFFGATSYSGLTELQGGVLRFSGDATLGSGNLRIHGGVLGLDGTLARDLGTGAGQIRFTAAGGFAAYDGDLTVTLSGDAGLTWGSTANFYSASGSGSTMTLGDTSATHRVTLTNPISFSNTARTFDVRSGAAAVDATLGGPLTSSGTSGRLIKTGAGVLELTATSTFTGAMGVQQGVLLLGATGSVSANYLIEGGVLGLGAGDLTRALGTGVGQVRLTTDGSGFAAFGADRTVNIGGGTALTWGSTANFFTVVADQSVMALSAAKATHTVSFANNLDLNGSARTIRVGGGAAAVDARMTGVVSGTGSSGLVKTGAGILFLDNDGNTYAGATTVSEGHLGGDGKVPGDLVVLAGAGFAAQVGKVLHVAGSVDLSAANDRVVLLGEAPTTRTVVLTYAGTPPTGTFDDLSGLPEKFTVDYSVSGELALLPPAKGTLVLIR